MMSCAACCSDCCESGWLGADEGVDEGDADADGEETAVADLPSRMTEPPDEDEEGATIGTDASGALSEWPPEGEPPQPVSRSARSPMARSGLKLRMCTFLLAGSESVGSSTPIDASSRQMFRW